MIDAMYEFLAKIGFNEPLHSPVTHMPMGLVIGALIFFGAALILRQKKLIITARHVSILAFIFAFPTILLGVIDWIHYYHAAMMTPIKIKIVLASIVLVVLAAGIILGSEVKVHSISLAILYSIAFVAVVGLGYYGAGIIYGRGVELKINDTKTNTSMPQPAPPEQKLGIFEMLGNNVPLDLLFVTETGKEIKLRDAIKGPTILSIVYYKCPNACDFLLTGITSALRSYNAPSGSEPNLLSISIDDAEMPVDGMNMKKIAFESMQMPYPADKWHFLTGNAENIKKVTDAVGFFFIKKDDDFEHPVGIIILSPKGKVVRYIMGTEFLPVDFKMSLMEASNGITGPTIARVVRFCFSYNPKSRQYVFNLLKVSFTVISTLVSLFLLYLVISYRRRNSRGGR